ncbi:2-phospho-L-lactate guanylyltransferase [Halocatena pleomorpha]|uniref:2-phospho-L-lactate guanylyltransferase n=1 Tax=Halocatena pleomorpha TaxID=1785090 RepID=A0A3P3RM41_9EURY|nr:2-phospho-L-lactate guanylyltransferase [Halocatena pleomorpha]RRJ33473.1 2-phospho-L-lactate guanylyltransferase [Halocatena pleomorpha]
MTRVLVPYRVAEPKTRLAPVLDANERRELSRHMLDDVLSAVRAAGYDPTVLSTAPLSEKECLVDDRPLTTAVNAHLRPETAVVMADLALTTPAVISRLLETPGDVVVAPGRGGGTNALVARHPDFRVDYHGASYRDHLDRCETIGASVRTIDSYRLGTDIDEPVDLPELLIHGTGTAADWVDDRFTVCTDTETGRIGVERV